MTVAEQEKVVQLQARVRELEGLLARGECHENGADALVKEMAERLKVAEAQVGRERTQAARFQEERNVASRALDSALIREKDIVLKLTEASAKNASLHQRIGELTREIEKPTVRIENPKDEVGSSKVPLSVIPQNVLGLVATAMFEGARKYGRHNWRLADVRASIYFDATWRHLAAWWEGEDDDPDSGLHHAIKAIAGLIVLVDAIERGAFEDDRPPPSYLGWVSDANEHCEALIVEHPHPVPPITKHDLLEDE